MIIGGVPHVTVEFQVQEGSRFINWTAEELEMKGFRLLAVTRNAETRWPRGSDTIQAGDSVVIHTAAAALEDLSPSQAPAPS